MTATMLRAIEPARDAILERLPDPAQMDLPSLELLGRRADETVDRLRGRSRRPVWAWVLGGLALAAIALVTASVVLTWSRGRAEPDGDDTLDDFDSMGRPGSLDGSDLGATADLPPVRGKTTGLTAAEGSLLSYDPVEGRDA